MKLQSWLVQVPEMHTPWALQREPRTQGGMFHDQRQPHTAPEGGFSGRGTLVNMFL